MRCRMARKHRRSLCDCDSAFDHSECNGEPSRRSNGTVDEPPDSVERSLTDSDPSVTDYVLEVPAKCPRCYGPINEKTLIEEGLMKRFNYRCIKCDCSFPGGVPEAEVLCDDAVRADSCPECGQRAG